MNDTTLAIRKFSDLANPTKFLALSAKLMPWMIALTALCLIAGLYLAFTTDQDYQQGYTSKWLSFD